MPPYGGSSTQTLECTVLYPMLDVFSSVLIYALKYLDLSSCIFVSFPYHYKSYTHVHELSRLHDYITLLEYINCTRYRFLSFDGAGNLWQCPGCRSGLPQSTGDADLFHPMWGSWPVAILLHTLLVVLLSPLNYTYTVSLTTTPWKDSHTHSWSWLVAESKKIDNTAYAYDPEQPRDPFFSLHTTEMHLYTSQMHDLDDVMPWYMYIHNGNAAPRAPPATWATV